MLDEVSIMRELNHPNVLKFYNFFENSSSYYIILELMAGGELFDSIARKLHYTELEARVVMQHLLLGIQHCHQNNIIHRDLKPGLQAEFS